MSEIITRNNVHTKDTLLHRMRTFVQMYRRIQSGGCEDSRLPGNVYLAPGGEILALPRIKGDSRYPYGSDGFNFWAYASGYMHANEGLLSLLLRASEGREPNAAFFAGFLHGKSYRFLPLLQVPVCGDESAERFTVFTPAAVYYVSLVHGVVFCVRAFSPGGRTLTFSLLAENQGSDTKRLYLSNYLNPFLRHQIQESDEDRWFKEIRVLRGEENSSTGFHLRVNEDRDRHTSVTRHASIRRTITASDDAGILGEELTPSRTQYVGGTIRGLHAAESLRRGSFGEPLEVCTFIENAIAGDLVHLQMPAGSWARIDTQLEEAPNEGLAVSMATGALDAERLDTAVDQAAQSDHKRHGSLTARVENVKDAWIAPLNPFLENLKRQVEFCSLLKGYAQLAPNSLIGIRDVFQSLEALTFWRPEAAREKLLEAIEYMTPGGRFFRQYSLPTGTGVVGRMDLRYFIDQAAWVISCAATYCRVTGDFSLLSEQRGFHEIVDEKAAVVRRSAEVSSVLDHLLRAVYFLLDHRDHGHTGCLRAMYGDWNDALDGLGLTNDPDHEFGTGVSVMASLQLRQNLNELLELLGLIDVDDHAATKGALGEAREQLDEALMNWAVVRHDANKERRVLHGWGDKRNYLVGSFKDPDGTPRDGVTASAFWLLSGMLERDPSMREEILHAFDRLDSKYGLRTFAPAFQEDATGVGRIVKLPPGTAENGAVYIHATAFAIMGLFAIGEPQRAWDQLRKVLPFSGIHEGMTHSPFVMPNSYGDNPEKNIDGENMNDWQTGSSNVVLKTLIRFVFGFEPAIDGLYIQPASWAPFGSFSFDGCIRSTRVSIRYENRNGAGRSFQVNGVDRPGAPDPTMKIDRLFLSAGELAGTTQIDVLVRD